MEIVCPTSSRRSPRASRPRFRSKPNSPRRRARTPTYFSPSRPSSSRSRTRSTQQRRGAPCGPPGTGGARHREPSRPLPLAGGSACSSRATRRRRSQSSRTSCRRRSQPLCVTMLGDRKDLEQTSSELITHLTELNVPRTSRRASGRSALNVIDSARARRPSPPHLRR